MNELPLQYKKAAARFQSITDGGLTLHPVRVRDYDLFQLARPALEVLQSSLPVRYLSMPLLQVYFQLDVIGPLTSGAASTGLWGSALLALSLALRLGEGMEPEERIRQFRPVVTAEDKTRLKALRATINGEEMIEITPVQFQRLRQIIAEQNGVELPSDYADPELVKAERDLAAMRETTLKADLEQLVASVCALTGADEGEIDEWPIRKLRTRANALQRAMQYIVCGVGEMSGAKWKGGNPVPHPFYERGAEGSAALTDLNDFAGGAAARGALGREQN